MKQKQPSIFKLWSMLTRNTSSSSSRVFLICIIELIIVHMAKQKGIVYLSTITEQDERRFIANIAKKTFR